MSCCDLPEPAPRPRWVDGRVLLDQFVGALLCASSAGVRAEVMALHKRLINKYRRSRRKSLFVIRLPRKERRT